jgi:lipopolysaccharide transport system permease protein/teichoic acid transport system permease protein
MTLPTTEAVASPRPIRRRPGFVSLVRQGLSDLTGRRRLVRYLVLADLKRTHADTLFGQIWWILDPLLQMVVYAILVSVIFQRSTPDFPLFLFAAILPWKWFSTTVNETAISVTARQSLIRQVQFPKIVLPFSSVVAGTVSFAFGLIALGIVYLFYLERLSAWVLLIPLIAAVQFLFTVAFGVLVAAVNAFYRDVQNVLRHLLRLWFYLSPALYSLDNLNVGPTFKRILELNPFAVLMESYRDVTWGETAPDFFGLGVLTIVSIVFLFIAVYVFKRAEPAFARIL